MGFNHDYLQENRKYSAAENFIGLEYSSLTQTVIGRVITHVVKIAILISRIVWRVIFVNQYYNSPTEFVG